MTLHIPRVISARNANDALHEGLWWLASAGSNETSRNGPVLVAPGPVITHYTHPSERVLFSAVRDANPFFHMYEAMWMLAGRNDAASVANFAKTMGEFTDEAGILNGAYGHRWRNHFGWDQLVKAAEELRTNPSSRRVVLEMWDPNSEGDFYKATHGSKDVPCNTHVYFGIDANGLNMTVCNRSNDMIWGGYGANYVHMGMLQEVMAAAVGVPVGSYYQMSNNFHVYPARADTERLIRWEGRNWNVLYKPDDRYDVGLVRGGITRLPMFPVGSYPLKKFLELAERLAGNPLAEDPLDPLWIRGVWRPMMGAHTAYKNGEFEWAANYLERNCLSRDWAVAGVEWINRRVQAKEKNKCADNST